FKECSCNQRRGFMSRNSLLTIKSYRIGIAHALAAKNVERRTNRQINPAAAQLRNIFQVLQRIRSAGVGRRNRNPLSEIRHQLAINAVAQTLDVHSMNEEFSARGRK